MELAKVIPQVFYDLIARFIPGLLALFVWSISLKITIGKIFEHIYGTNQALLESSFILGTSILIIAYLLGQFLSPLSDLLERTVLTKVSPKSFNLLSHQLDPNNQEGNPYELQPLIKQEMGNENAKVTASFGLIWQWYDFIRVNNTDAGARLTKMRSEYRMFEGCAVGLGIGIILHVPSVYCSPGTAPWLLVFLLIGLLVACWGAIRTSKMFQQSIINHYQILQSSKAIHSPIQNS